MNEYKFRKYVYENPDIIGEPFKISRKQASEIYEKGFPSAREIISGAKRKYPDADWSEFDTILKKKESAHSKQRKEFHIAARHRLAAACIALLLLLSYFTFVPAGRTLASEMIQFIVHVFGNTMDVIRPLNNYLIVLPNTSERFSGSAEFEEKTGLHPLLLTNDNIQIDYLEYIVNEHEIHYLSVYYVLDNGLTFWTRQEWNHAAIEYHQYEENHGFHDVPITEDHSIRVPIAESIKEIEAVLLLPDSVFHFYATNEAIFSTGQEALKAAMLERQYVITERFPNSRITTPLQLSYKNFDDVYQETRFMPFYFHTDWLTLDSIQLEEDALKTKTLRSHYKDENGTHLYVIQTWNFKGSEITTYFSLTDFREVSIGDLYKIYYTLDPIDGEQSGLILLRDSVLSFSIYNVNDQRTFSKLMAEFEKKETIDILNKSMYNH